MILKFMTKETGLAGASDDSSILSKSIPVQVERSEQDARAFYYIQCSSIKSPCNPYVERASLIILNTTTKIPQPTLSVSHYDYDYDHDYLLAADSTALVHGASSNINSAVTSVSLCDRNIKQAWVFAMFPHATPDYSDLLRRCSIGLVPALPSSHSSRPEADWVHGIDGRLPDNYYSHENDMSCMVSKSPCSDLIKVG